MGHKKISITKASGEQATFDSNRLKRSLQRSGANEEVIQKVINEVSSHLYEGISTKEIYRMAFGLLRKSSRPSAARYKLKKAIMELGPSGFPFEKFVAAVLNFEGYETKVGEIVQGICVDHEIDVMAYKDDHHFMIECKFHSEPGRTCNVKVPLYIQSRFKDVEATWLKLPGHENKYHQGWVVTNTRFTSDAIQYGNCAGLKLMSWDYPENGSLKDRIDKSGLHPVTSLTTITKAEKQLLLDKEIVLCMDVCGQPSTLKSIGIHEKRHKRILAEADDLCTKYLNKINGNGNGK